MQLLVTFKKVLQLKKIRVLYNHLYFIKKATFNLKNAVFWVY